MGFCSLLVTLSFKENICSILFSLDTLHIKISANCKIIPACSCPQIHNCCGEWEGWDPVNWFNHSSWVAIVTPTDRHKSVRNRCVIEDLGGVFVLSNCFLDFSVGVGAFVIRLSQISSFFYYDKTLMVAHRHSKKVSIIHWTKVQRSTSVD